MTESYKQKFMHCFPLCHFSLKLWQNAPWLIVGCFSIWSGTVVGWLHDTVSTWGKCVKISAEQYKQMNYKLSLHFCEKLCHLKNTKPIDTQEAKVNHQWTRIGCVKQCSHLRCASLSQANSAMESAVWAHTHESFAADVSSKKPITSKMQQP